MSLNRQKFDKKYKREKFKFFANQRYVQYDGEEEHHREVDEWEAWQKDMEPSEFEFNWGRLLTMLTKLNIKSAKDELRNWYW